MLNTSFALQLGCFFVPKKLKNEKKHQNLSIFRLYLGFLKRQKMKF
jgi:hypothetical protein